MKTNRVILISGMLTICSWMANLAFSQESKVWARVDPQVFESISNSPEFETWKSFNQIQVIAPAFPASRNNTLRTVYEISATGGSFELLQAVGEQKNWFFQAEVVEQAIPMFVPNDMSLGVAYDYALHLINAPAAWDISRGDADISIAITDVNYHLNHEELMGKYTLVSPNTNADYTHGTAVAILAAGNTNNGIGKSSIGYQSTLQLRANTYNQLLEASYAGARVINMSWSSGCLFNAYAQQIIDEVHANGTVLIAAAGNGSTCGGADNLVYPAAYNHVIAVSSVGPNDNHERVIGNSSTTHQHNSSVDICAPGYDVAISTAPGVYTTGSGTSFAAPMVSGTVALMLAVNNCLTPDQIEMILEETAVDIDVLNPAYSGKLGAGRLNAFAAVSMAATFNTIAVTPHITINCEDMSQEIELQLPGNLIPDACLWNNGDTLGTLVVMESGTYSAIVHDQNGCVATFDTVIQLTQPLELESLVTPVRCEGMNNGKIELTVYGGMGNNTITWSNGTSGNSASNLTAGWYSVQIIDAAGCQLDQTFEVTEPVALTAQLLVNNNELMVEAQGGTLPYQYEWNTGDETANLTDIEQAFYEVQVTDAMGCKVSANYYHLEEEQSTAGLEENASENWLVYPNPAYGNAVVDWNVWTAEKVELITMEGQVLLSEVPASTEHQKIISAPTPGEYMVRITLEDGMQYVKRMVFI
jgi:hypothetical protein